jgi:hypothetical protein
MDDYKIREVEVHLKPSVTLKVEIASLAALKKLLDDLDGHGFVTQQERHSSKHDTPPDPKRETRLDAGADPVSKLETTAELPEGTLTKFKIVGFKDEIPQLLRPTVFSNVTDAVLVLLFAVEVGLQRKKIDYEGFKGLFDSQSIKSGSPLSMLVNNLKNSNYIDKKTYDAERNLSLSSKGQTKAIEVLKAVCKAS